MFNEELWMDVLDYENIYAASNLGNIKSLVTGKVIKQSDNGYGYNKVVLSKNGIKKTHNVHKVIAEAFNGKIKLTIDHINNNKKDNRITNLQVVTHRQNKSKGVKRELPTGVRKIHDSRFRSVINIGKKCIHLGYFNTIQEASEAYNIKLKEIENGTI